jgi:biopolymer transport protein ExbD
MAAVLQPAEPGPLAEMNMTPLIDVMLVLLIMFIITIPVQSHAVKIDVPPACPQCELPNPVRNVVVITAHDSILWNGEPVSFDTLRHYLAVTQQMQPIPELHLRPEATARYELVDTVLAVTKRAEVKKLGFVGNEAYRNAF